VVGTCGYWPVLVNIFKSYPMLSDYSIGTKLRKLLVGSQAGLFQRLKKLFPVAFLFDAEIMINKTGLVSQESV